MKKRCLKCDELRDIDYEWSEDEDFCIYCWEQMYPNSEKNK